MFVILHYELSKKRQKLEQSKDNWEQSLWEKGIRKTTPTSKISLRLGLGFWLGFRLGLVLGLGGNQTIAREKNRPRG